VIDDIGVAIAEGKSEEGMKYCNQNAIAIGGSYKLNADSWGHYDHVEERVTNGHISVIGHRR
jgi:hypothetical protein